MMAKSNEKVKVGSETAENRSLNEKGNAGAGYLGALERSLARNYPLVHALVTPTHSLWRPTDEASWEDLLILAKNSQPILDEIRRRGIPLALLNTYVPPEVDQQPIYEVLLERLPRIDEPIMLADCVRKLLDSKATTLVKKHRPLFLELTRKWNKRKRSCVDSVLAQCCMKAVREVDVPEVVSWLHDRTLDPRARSNYALDLEHFAKKPGLARDALIELLNDDDVGGSAIWSLAGAMKAESLPLLRTLEESSPIANVRKQAAFAAKKVEAAIRRTARQHR